MFLSIFLFFCGRQERKEKLMYQKGFITKPGLYVSKSVLVVIKQYNDGSLTFGVSDRKNKIIYQHSVFSSYSNNSYWFLYKDENENIWFYTSDLQDSKVLLKDNSNNYSVHDFCRENIKLPAEVVRKNSTYCI